MYGEADCAQQAIIPPGYNAKNASINAALGQQQTELTSLLGTLETQAHELRGIAISILQRVSPMPEEQCAEKQCFGSGHIGRAEEIRSIQRETINTLLALAKLV